MHRRPCMLAGTGLLLALAHASPASAGNTMHPRTPVLWPEHACILDVELGPEASYAFAYEIPYEDISLSVDELDDSRRHQFVAFCRQWPAGEPPPAYISLADLQRAIDGQVETKLELLDDPEATLETSVEWAGCWTRVTPDDARRPITQAAAAEPVLWTLAEVPAGTWMLAGYTWEPPLNLWSRAPGVLRLHDAQQPAPAAAAMGLTPEGIAADEVASVPVCVAAAPEAEVALEWADTRDEPRVWTQAASQTLGEADTLEFSFPSAEAYLGATLLLRARVEPPAGAEYITQGLVRLNVYAPPLGGDGDGDSEGGDSEGGDSEGAETGGAHSSESGGDAGDDTDQEEAGGGCSLARPTPAGLPLLALPLLLWRRRLNRA